MTSIVRWLLWLMLVFSPMTALAQSYMTTVTAQVKDANGTLYNSCRYSATLVNLSTSTLTLGGTALPDQFKQVTGTQCDANGNLSTKLVANTALIPNNSQWRFTICDSNGANCFNVQTTISGTTIDITALIQSAAVVLPISNTTLLTGNFTYTGNNTFNGTGVFTNDVTIGGVFVGPRKNCNFVFDGDSITAGTGASLVGTTDWPSQAMTMNWFAGHGTKFNVAVGGSTAADAVARYTANVHPLSPAVTGKCGYYFVNSGHNDLSNGGAAGGPEGAVPQTGAAVAGYLQTLWADARADGFNVIATTIKRASVLTGTKETERINLNKLIRASTGYNYLVNLDAVLTDPTDTTFLTGDGVHPNDNGYLVYARYVNQVMLSGGSFASSEEVNPPIGGGSYVASGSPPSAITVGDVSAARSATQGVYWLGSDGTVFIFRNGAVTTLKNVGLAVTIDGSSPAGIGSGDLAAIRAANQGTVWFGNDGARIFRNGNIANWSPVGLAVSIDGTVPSSIAQGDISAARSSTTGDIWLGNDSNVRLQRASVTLTNLTNSDWNASPASIHSTSGWLKISGDTFGTTTNCASAAGTCAAASAGSVSIAASATTVTVATTAVTANSEIFVQEDSSLGTRLGVTCNTTAGRTYMVTARTAATSFVITTSSAPTTNPACLSYTVIN